MGLTGKIYHPEKIDPVIQTIVESGGTFDPDGRSMKLALFNPDGSAFGGGSTDLSGFLGPIPADDPDFGWMAGLQLDGGLLVNDPNSNGIYVGDMTGGFFNNRSAQLYDNGLYVTGNRGDKVIVDARSIEADLPNAATPDDLAAPFLAVMGIGHAAFTSRHDGTMSWWGPTAGYNPDNLYAPEDPLFRINPDGSLVWGDGTAAPHAHLSVMDKAWWGDDSALLVLQSTNDALNTVFVAGDRDGDAGFFGDYGVEVHFQGGHFLARPEIGKIQMIGKPGDDTVHEGLVLGQGNYYAELRRYGPGLLEAHNDSSGVAPGFVARSPDGTAYKLTPPNGGGAATWVAA